MNQEMRRALYELLASVEEMLSVARQANAAGDREEALKLVRTARNSLDAAEMALERLTR